MRRLSALLTLALLLVPTALPTSPGPTPVEARGPDEDGAFVLVYDEVPVGARLRLLVTRDDAGDLAHATRDLPAATASRVEAPFLPAEGAGDYAVALEADGHAGAPLAFRVNATGSATARLAWTIAEAPTYLNLTSDTVNADGKLKSPGDALVTRLTLSDANGMGDLDGLVYVVTRESDVVDTGDVARPWAANETRVDVEHRYARVPLAAANYSLLIRAVKDGAPVANATRTFVIREVAPTLHDLRVADVLPDDVVEQATTLVLSDKNGVSPTAAVEARVYRASTRVDGASVTVRLGAPTMDAELASYPLSLTFPARLTAGAYRVSVYADGALLGSSPFNVTALPGLAAVRATPGARLSLALNLTGEGIVSVRLDDGNGSATASTHALPAGETVFAFDAPSRAATIAWNVTLRARVDGPVLENATGTWHRDVAGPLLVVTPVRGPPRMPALWDVRAEGYDLAGATANLTLERWDGVVVAASVSFDGARLRMDGPALEAGRYVARLTLALPNGSVGEASWPIEVAPWLRIELGAPDVQEREARIPVRNVGGADARGFVAEANGATIVRLETASGVVLPVARGGRAVFDSPLAAGEDAVLVVRAPEGPLPAGSHPADVRVLALGARP